MVNASRGGLRMFRYLICLSFLSRPNARILRASCRFNVVSKIGDTLVKANEWDKRTRRQRHFSPARRQLKMTFCKIFYFTNNDCRLNYASAIFILSGTTSKACYHNFEIRIFPNPSKRSDSRNSCLFATFY